jgi:hypothetical protein
VGRYGEVIGGTGSLLPLLSSVTSAASKLLSVLCLHYSTDHLPSQPHPAHTLYLLHRISCSPNMKLVLITISFGFACGTVALPFDDTQNPTVDARVVFSSPKSHLANRQHVELEQSDIANPFNETTPAIAGDSPPPRSETPPFYDPRFPASDELWSNALCKGSRFVAAMLGTDEDAGRAFGSTKTPPTIRSEWQGGLHGNIQLVAQLVIHGSNSMCR